MYGLEVKIMAISIRVGLEHENQCAFKSNRKSYVIEEANHASSANLAVYKTVSLLVEGGQPV